MKEYLYNIIAKNLVKDDQELFDISERDKNKGRMMIKKGEIIREDNASTIYARYLFAKTLKKLLEDSDSDLSKRIKHYPNLQQILQELYRKNISKINEWSGKKVVAYMNNPLVVKDITAIVGKKIKKLGEGTFGKVYSTEKGYAVKALKEKELDGSTINEISILRYLNHPNVLSVEAVQLKPVEIALPLAERSLEGMKISNQKERKIIFYQLFRAVAYLHSKYIRHLDIKPDNALVFRNVDNLPVIKLADFGLSQPYAKEDKTTNVVTLWWRAPELLLGDRNYNEKVDVWSVGVMLLNEIMETKMFVSESEMATLYKIIDFIGLPSGQELKKAKNLRGWSKIFDEKFKQKDLKRQDISNAKDDFDNQEFMVLKNTLTWPSKRMPALQILNLPYFDSVRDLIEIEIPANPIIKKPCGELMLDDQAICSIQEKFSSKDRKILYQWLWEIVDEMMINKNIYFHSIVLFDCFIQKKYIDRLNLQKYACAALHISNSSIGEYLIDYSDLIYFSANQFNESQLIDAINDILTVLDFAIVFPTAYNFVEEFIDKTDKITDKKLTEIQSILFLLYLNYEYATTYTTNQLAQIAIEALGIKLNCLKKIPQLYNSSIYNYFMENASKQIRNIISKKSDQGFYQKMLNERNC